MYRVYLAGAAAVAATVAAGAWTDAIDFHLAANISLIYISALVTAFTVLYGIRSNWRANQIGRVFFVKSVTFTAVLWLITLQNWWDVDWGWRQEIRFIVYTLGAIAYLPMVITLVRKQQADRRQRDEEEQ